MPEVTDWGKEIKRLRLENGHTHRSLAAAAGVSRSFLNDIENGLTVGKTDVVAKTMAFFGFDLDACARTSPEEQLRLQAMVETNPARRSVLAAKRLVTMFPLTRG
jgi:transcriptional regulator with XRE-family HTH domain